LRIEGGAVQVRLPSGVPGRDGWRAAEGVEVTPDKISGKVKIGLISRDRFSVDRHTGDIDMMGGSIFSGKCEKEPDESTPAKCLRRRGSLRRTRERDREDCRRPHTALRE